MTLSDLPRVNQVMKNRGTCGPHTDVSCAMAVSGADTDVLKGGESYFGKCSETS